MTTTINFHRVKQIQLKANCTYSCGKLACWQTLVLLGDDNQELGEVTMFLDDLNAAIPHGEFPDMRQLAPLTIVDAAG